MTIWEWLGHIQISLRTALFLMAAILLFAVIGCYQAFHCKTGNTSQAKIAPEVTQPDGSKVLMVIPIPAKNLPPAPHVQPKASTEYRRGQVTVKPTPIPKDEVQYVEPDKDGKCPIQKLLDCPPVTVDYSIIRDKEGAYRVIASSPDGEVTSGVDIPILEFTGNEPRNSLHTFGNTSYRAYAVSYTRNYTLFGQKVDIGAAVTSTPQDRFVPMLGGGIRW